VPRGFGNYHQSEALPGALPQTQNSPQRCNLGLYAEQISGTAFTRTRDCNLKSWVYRILPSVVRPDYTSSSLNINNAFVSKLAPNPLRWSPFHHLLEKLNFLESFFHVSGHALANIWLYSCKLSMANTFFSNNDGEMLLLPYEGEIEIKTEFGHFSILPGAIAVIPRGIKFQVNPRQGIARGYVCENKGAPFRLPELGIIGANGLANLRHFIYPDAGFEEKQEECILLCKNQDHLWETHINYHPLNVVAWQGNYAPYSYDLSLFNTINSVSFDHPDPSIYTVLTSSSAVPGVANLDFVIFPPRWVTAEHTFRPPYYHRNVMNELMGLIKGKYDAKEEGFEVGGLSIHNCMTGHGPDVQAFAKASSSELKPEYLANTLAFMLESQEPWGITQNAYDNLNRQKGYTQCWLSLESHFATP
jgi:homogentisate 1,2-dioxygenase